MTGAHALVGRYRCGCLVYARLLDEHDDARARDRLEQRVAARRLRPARVPLDQAHVVACACWAPAGRGRGRTPTRASPTPPPQAARGAYGSGGS